MDDDLVILDAFVFLEVADWGLEGYGIDCVGVELWLGVFGTFSKISSSFVINIFDI